MNLKQFIFINLAILILVLCFSGCQTKKDMYSWGSFETQMYEHLNGLSPSVQIQALERDRRQIEASGIPAPPGFYAHLGFLHSEIGDDVSAIFYFETEKANFPEAAHFMDFLLGRYGIGELNDA